MSDEDLKIDDNAPIEDHTASGGGQQPSPEIHEYDDEDIGASDPDVVLAREKVVPAAGNAEGTTNGAGPKPGVAENDSSVINLSDASLPKPETPQPAKLFLDPELLRQREKTASDIGKLVVWVFAGCVAACFVPIYLMLYWKLLGGPLEFTEVREWLALFDKVGAFVAGPLGFVLGFYFRKD